MYIKPLILYLCFQTIETVMLEQRCKILYPVICAGTIEV